MSVNRPMVSILMALYNYDKFLHNTLTSILMEEFNDFELLIWDDGSTDNSRSIAESFAAQDQRIKVFSDCNNCGSFSKVLMKLLPHARGEYINISDPDDLAHKTRLLTLVTAAQQHPEAIFYYGRVDAVSHQDHSEIYHSYASKFNFLEYFNRNYIPNGAMLVRTSDFKKIGGIDTDLLWAEDYDFRLRLSLNGAFHFVFTTFPLYTYIKHSESYTTYRFTQSGENKLKKYFITKHCTLPTSLSNINTYTQRAQFFYRLAHHTAGLFKNKSPNKLRALLPIRATQLRAQIHQLGIRPGMTLFMASSVGLLGNIWGGPKQFINLVLDILGPDGQLIMPDFTIDNTQFKEKIKSPSLVNHFKNVKNIATTQNQKYNYIIWGQNATTLAKKLSTPNGLYTCLNQKNTSILMCGQNTIDFFIDPVHLTKVMPILKNELGHQSMFRYLGGMMEMNLLDNQSGFIGNAASRLIPADQFQSVIYKAIEKDPLQFLCNDYDCPFCSALLP